MICESLNILSQISKLHLYDKFLYSSFSFFKKCFSLLPIFKYLQILFKKVLKGEVTPDHLIRMSPEELASKELAAWRRRENRHVRLSMNMCLSVLKLTFFSHREKVRKFNSEYTIIDLLFCTSHYSSSIAAAAAKSLQSCPTLCDLIDGSPPGFPVPGILQARTLQWVAISFSNA